MICVCDLNTGLRFAEKLPVLAVSLQILVDNPLSGSVTLAPIGLIDRMTKSRVTLFPPSSIEEIIQQINVLDEAAFDALYDDIVGGAGFETDRKRCEDLASRIGTTSEVVALVFSALSFLYTRIKSTSPEDPSVLLSDLISNFPSDRWTDAERVRASERLRLLLLNEKIDQLRKVHRLKRGFLKNAASFSSFLDLRPDFQAGNTEVHGFVPIIQFRITTDSDMPHDKEFVFQMDANGLDALKDAIKSVDKKLEAIKNSNALSALVYIEKN